MSFAHFPRTHLVIIAVLLFGLTSVGVAALLDTDEPDVEAAALVPLEQSLPAIEPTVAQTMMPVQPPIEAPVIEPEPVPLEIRTHTIKRGESLSKLFAAQGLSPTVLHRIATSKPHGEQLKNIYPGQEVSLGFDETGELVRLTYVMSPLLSLQFDKDEKTFNGVELRRTPDTVVKHASAAIEHSLFVASQRAGIDDQLTMNLAQIFQWDIDFVLDIRSGDTFSVMYEEQHLDGQKIANGNVLAAEFVNQGEAFRAVRYEDQHGKVSYYSPEGRNMRKAFLRAPLQFSRISSNFNLRRVHPLFKKVMPHRGIDYAAPRGTPILAAGNGRVVTAGKTQPNGNFIVIQHGEQFQTKYLHLTRFARGIRSGARVEQGDTIGYVGATGWATAPHLHYEFLVNGVHKNPRTVKLPDATPVPEAERDRFETVTAPLFAKLEAFKQDTALAAAR